MLPPQEFNNETNNEIFSLTSQLPENRNKRKRDSETVNDEDGTIKKPRKNKVKLF